MKGNRLWILGTVAAIAAIVLVGWLLGVSPKLTEISAATAERDSVESMNTVQAAEIATLRDKQENFDDLETQLDKVRSSIPDRVLAEDFSDAVSAAATTTASKLTGITLAEAGPWGVAAVPDGAPVAESGEGVESPPIPTAPEGVYTVAVTITLEAEPASFFGVVDMLQKGPRLFLVTNLTYDYDEDKTGTIVGYLFVIVDPNAPVPTADQIADPQPAPTETPTPSESPTPTPTPAP